MTEATTGRSRVLMLAVAPLLLAVVLYAWQRPELTTDPAFRVTAPLSGTPVQQPVTLSWTAAPGASSYAVVIDHPVPAPGALVRAGDHVLLLSGRQLQLHLGSATQGSPSVRNVHEVVVVPLDREGKRRGEDVAWQRVHTRS